LAEGVGLAGPDGLLSQVTKAVLERSLDAEMTGHLGYDKLGSSGPVIVGKRQRRLDGISQIVLSLAARG
jgi:transposase-like protein